MLDFTRHVARVPVPARVVEAEIEFHTIFLGQTQVHIDQVDRGHIASLPEQVGRRIGDELAVSRANQDHGIDADGFHVAEVGVPLLLAPVLVGNIVGNLIQECSRNL